MASLDEFFNRALQIAGDLGKARVQRRQKQQNIENLATNKALALEGRRVATGEKRVETTVALGQQQIELEKASLAVRKQLGLGQLKIGGRQAGVQEGGLTLEQKRFKRSSELFQRLFPDPDAGPGGIPGDFRGRSDIGVLESAQALASGKKPSVLSNPKVQEVIRQVQKRSSLKNTLEQDLLSLR